MTLDFSNTVSLIVGASSGMGAEVLKMVTASGGQTIAVALNKDEMEKTASLTGYPDKVKVWTGDMSVPQEIDRLQLFIKEKGIKLNHVVFCVGLSLSEPAGEYNLEKFNQLMQVNLTSAFLVLTKIVSPLVADGGSVVLVSSIRGRTGTDSHSAGYAAAKAGIINLAKTFSLEFAPRNIRVNVVAPGPTYPTNMSKDWPESMRNELSRKIPLGRLGSPEEIAAPILFLMSSMASYITGQTLDVNGGLWMN